MQNSETKKILMLLLMVMRYDTMGIVIVSDLGYLVCTWDLGSTYLTQKCHKLFFTEKLQKNK